MELRVISIMKTLEWRKDKSLPVYTDANIKDIRICEGDINCAYRAFLDLPIGDIEPIAAAILGFPNATPCITSVKDCLLGGMTDHTIDAAATHWANKTPLERIKRFIAPGILVRGKQTRNAKYRQYQVYRNVNIFKRIV